MTIHANDLPGNPGEIVGWAPVVPGSQRFVTFLSPRTKNKISGFMVLLEGEDRSVWIERQGKWNRAEPYQRKAYLMRYDKETETGELDTIPITDDNVEIAQL